MRKLWIRRKGMSTMIGGVIVLSLFLTALASMVLVSQQFDQYQTQASKMSQYNNQRLSEYLAANPPGLVLLTTDYVPGWGSGCATPTANPTYACYNMTVNNVGSVGVQIVGIYINSTGSGCTSLCVLKPTLAIAPYAFNQADQFVNRGETNHVVVLALPRAFLLPEPPSPTFPMNAIYVATSMGNVFAFQFPFQEIPGISEEAYSQGILKVAYQKVSSSGFDSKNEPGPVRGGSGGTTPSGASGYCHNESVRAYPAGPGWAEELTVSGLSDNNLWFVNPWITAGNSKAILNSVDSGYTQLYMYVIVVNTSDIYYTPTGGTIDLTWYASNHIDGSLFGVYYNGQFYTPSTFPASGVKPNMFYYAIFKIDNSIFMLYNPPSHSAMFWGSASITNVGASGTGAEDETFYSGTILSSGFWIRYEASTGSCA